MNPESGSRRTPYDIEAIAGCARIITEILNDNRETINLIFQDINKKLKEDDDNNPEFMDMSKPLL